MNYSRLDYIMAKDNSINITAYLLLGFVEGEGCFSINRGNNYRLDFSLTQTYSNLELIKKIKVYLENLPNTNGNYAGELLEFLRLYLRTLINNLLLELRLRVLHLLRIYLFLSWIV